MLYINIYFLNDIKLFSKLEIYIDFMLMLVEHEHFVDYFVGVVAAAVVVGFVIHYLVDDGISYERFDF